MERGVNVIESEKLYEIFCKVKPELKDKDSLKGLKLIDDMGFDSVEIVELISELEGLLGKRFDDISELLDIIQDYDAIEAWYGKMCNDGE